MTTDESKRSRRGPAPLSAADKRGHTISVRLNAIELESLDSLRKTVCMQRGEYLRAAALHCLPPTIPEINRQAWAELSRVAGNLNQAMRAINQGLRSDLTAAEVSMIRDQVQSLRLELLGVQHEGED